MDLLNFLIQHEGLLVKNNVLYITLPAHEGDTQLHYHLELSTNSTEIYGYLGYDATVNVSKLTEKNLFEYLTTSPKLDSFYSGDFKGAKQTRFLKFLETKGFRRFDGYYQKNMAALTCFQKHREYEIYKFQHAMLSTVASKSNIVSPTSQDQFYQFLLLHGVNTISKIDDEELLERWNKFTKVSWSGLMAFLPTPI